jgi:hypothetical protein
MQIPWERLGIPHEHRAVLASDAPAKSRLAAAKGLLPVAPGVQLAMFYILLGDRHEKVVAAAKRSFAKMPQDTLIAAINQKTHPKILEYLTETRIEEGKLMDRVLEIRNCNDRTVLSIAAHADAGQCETLSRNQERLLLTPEVFLVLRDNPNCAAAWVKKMEGFLKMQGGLPKRGGTPAPSKPAQKEAPKTEPVVASAMAEVEAALLGIVSPSDYADAQIAEDLEMFDLGFLDEPEDTVAANPDVDPLLAGFKLDYKDEAAELSWNLLNDGSDGMGSEDTEERISVEMQIRDMTVGKKIKLAYLGNGESRRFLIRDSNKMVASAVVKSGRMNEREVEKAAGNRNLDMEIIRVLARNRAYLRRYAVKVLLVNNPKTPQNVSISLLKSLSFKDIKALTANKSVSNVIQAQCKRMYDNMKKRL